MRSRSRYRHYRRRLFRRRRRRHRLPGFGTIPLPLAVPKFSRGRVGTF